MAKMKSIVSYENRNNKYGNNKYRGNCTGELIKDLIKYYEPKKVFDPMVGSGTTKDVCEELQVDYICRDLNPTWGGWNALEDEVEESSDLIFWHPPYDDIIQYSGVMWGEPDYRDLSRCKNYNEFIRKINKVQAKLVTSLRKNGRIAILVGDIKKKGVLYSIQKDMAWYGTPEQVIIKAQHNCWSDTIDYKGKFIPIVHEYLLIFKRDSCYNIPIKTVHSINIDLRTRVNQTWKDVVFAAMERLGGKATLQQLYREIQFHSKTKVNLNWKEQIRKVVQIYKDFVRIAKGVYQLEYLSS